MLKYNYGGGSQQLVKFSVEYYDKFSVIELDEERENFLYFPHYNRVVNVDKYSDNDSLINTLEYLNGSNPIGEDGEKESLYCLVTEPFIRFTIVNNLSIDRNYDDDDDDDDFDTSHIFGIYEDIKDNDQLYNFDNYKKSKFYINVLLETHWIQGYDDWDCNTYYIGILGNISISDLVKPSQERIIKLEEDEKKHHEQLYNEISEDPGFLF